MIGTLSLARLEEGLSVPATFQQPRLPAVKILVLAPAPYDTSPAMRFRAEQWSRYLERDGFRFTFAPFEDDALHRVIYRPGQYGRKALLTVRALARRLALLPRVRDFDVVLLHREAASLGPAVLEWLLARQRVPIVYDFDDPIWLPYRSPTNGVLSYLKRPGNVARICRLAAVVMVGNRLLAEWARKHARDVEVVPSTIDLERYPVIALAEGGTLTLGWTGSHSTLPFLECLAPTLRQFAVRQAYRLLVISHTDRYGIDGLPVEVRARRWRAETEAEDLLEMDIGLAPFPDTGWTPWRCHGKVLQYMAAGIPTVASPVGVLSDYIRDGENGFLAVTEADWIDRLVRLAEDTKLRRRMGQAGRATVAERYSARVWAPRVKEILLRAASGNRSHSAALAQDFA
jgi:glycosyltransferase involved in cell wall biosynthesis